MLIYFSYYLLIAFSAIFIPKKATKKQKIFSFCLLFLGIFLIVGLRNPSMGADLNSGNFGGYLGRYQYIAKKDWHYLLFEGRDAYELASYETGYVALNKLISVFGIDYQHLIICVSFVSLFPVFVIYRRYSENFEFSIIIYLALTCFLAVFSALRQSCAIAICFCSYVFLKKKKLIPFVLLVLLAATFHKTALIFLLAYPFYRIRISKKIRLFTLGLVGIVFLLRTQIFRLVVNFIGKDYQTDSNGAIAFLLLLIALYVLLALFSKDDGETNSLMNIFLLLILCQCFANIHSFVARVGYYFMPFLGLLIPKSIKGMRTENKTIFAPLFVVLFTVYGLYSIYSSGDSWAMAYPWTHF